MQMQRTAPQVKLSPVATALFLTVILTCSGVAILAAVRQNQEIRQHSFLVALAAQIRHYKARFGYMPSLTKIDPLKPSIFKIIELANNEWGVRLDIIHDPGKSFVEAHFDKPQNDDSLPLD